MGEGAGFESIIQYDLLGEIDEKTESLITKIDMDLRLKKRLPDMEKEFEEIKSSIQKGNSLADADKRVDLFIKKPDGNEIYFDITITS